MFLYSRKRKMVLRERNIAEAPGCKSTEHICKVQSASLSSTFCVALQVHSSSSSGCICVLVWLILKEAPQFGKGRKRGLPLCNHSGRQNCKVSEGQKTPGYSNNSLWISLNHWPQLCILCRHRSPPFPGLWLFVYETSHTYKQIYGFIMAFTKFLTGLKALPLHPEFISPQRLGDEMPPPFGSCFSDSEKKCIWRGCKGCDINWTSGKGSWAEDNCWYLTKCYINYHSEQMCIDSFFFLGVIYGQNKDSKCWSRIICC